MARKGNDRNGNRGEVMRLRLTRRPVADLTEKQMEDAVGGHEYCPTEAPTCPETCGDNQTCGDQATCAGTCPYTHWLRCRPDTGDSCATYCECGC